MNIIKLKNPVYHELKDIIKTHSAATVSTVLIKPVADYLFTNSSITIKEQLNKSNEIAAYEFISVMEHSSSDILFKMFIDNVFRYCIEEDALELLNTVSYNWYPNDFNIRVTYICQFMEIIDEYFYIDPISRNEIENIISHSVQQYIGLMFKNDSITLNRLIIIIYNNFKTELSFYLNKHVNAFYNYIFELYNNNLILIINEVKAWGNNRIAAI